MRFFGLVCVALIFTSLPALAESSYSRGRTTPSYTFSTPSSKDGENKAITDTSRHGRERNYNTLKKNTYRHPYAGRSMPSYDLGPKNEDTPHSYGDDARVGGGNMNEDSPRRYGNDARVGGWPVQEDRTKRRERPVENYVPYRYQSRSEMFSVCPATLSQRDRDKCIRDFVKAREKVRRKYDD